MKGIRRIVLPALALAVGLTGCGGSFLPYSHDIEKLELMQTVGLDETEEGKVQVTMSSGLRRKGDTGDTKPPQVFQQEGDTVYECALHIKTMGDGYITYTHTTECLLGERAAQRGIQELVDFLERDTEMRLNTDLFVVQGTTAGELIQSSAGEDSSIVDRLDAVNQDVEYTTSDTYVYTLKDLVMQLEENGCGLASALKLEENEAKVAGFACFGDDKLIGYFDTDQALGVNLLLNQISGGIVTVKLEDGSVVALRLRNAKCKWKPEFEGDTLKKLVAEVTIHAGLEELRGEENPEQTAVENEITAKMEADLRKRAEEVLAQCQDWQADVLHLKNKVELAKPAKKKVTEENWEDWFPSLEMEVQVVGIVDQTYDIDQPLTEYRK